MLLYGRQKCRLGGYVGNITVDRILDEIKIIAIGKHPLGCLFHKVAVLGGKHPCPNRRSFLPMKYEKNNSTHMHNVMTTVKIEKSELLKLRNRALDRMAGKLSI